MNIFHSTSLPCTHTQLPNYNTLTTPSSKPPSQYPQRYFYLTHHKPLLQRIKEPKFKNVLPLGFCVLDLGVTGLALFPNSSLAWIVTGLKDMGWYGVGWYPCPCGCDGCCDWD